MFKCSEIFVTISTFHVMIFDRIEMGHEVQWNRYGDKEKIYRNVDIVRLDTLRSLNRSLCLRSIRLGIKETTVGQVLKMDFVFHPYKIQVYQHLLAVEYQQILPTRWPFVSTWLPAQCHHIYLVLFSEPTFCYQIKLYMFFIFLYITIYKILSFLQYSFWRSIIWKCVLFSGYHIMQQCNNFIGVNYITYNAKLYYEIAVWCELI